MPEIKIKISDFEMKLLAHRTADVQIFAQTKIQNEIDRYEADLANKLVRNAFDKELVIPQPMDRQAIIQAYFDEEGYLDAAERAAATEAAQKAADHPLPSFIDVIV